MTNNFIITQKSHLYFSLVVCFLVSFSTVFAQEKEYIQFSGVVVTEDDNGEPQPLPYTDIAILNTSRGTVSEFDGFFSLVAAIGDTIVFSRLGYKSARHEIADTLTDDFYSWYQVMSQDSILLPEAVIYPWPSREHYKIEFLAMDVSNDLRRHADDNLAERVLREMRYEMPADGKEAYNLMVDNQIQVAKYDGQFKPQHIFDAMAWAKFIKAWKNGDFKKKKKKDK